MHLNVGLRKIKETVDQVEELRRDLRIKSQELEVKNAAANDKLKKMVKDQQEAEKKKVMSQEIQEQLHKQQEVIADKQMSVKEDLDKVEPAVIEAQNAFYLRLPSYLRTNLKLKKGQDLRDHDRPPWSPLEGSLPHTDTGKAGFQDS